MMASPMSPPTAAPAIAPLGPNQPEPSTESSCEREETYVLIDSAECEYARSSRSEDAISP
jgi:hypothetical protein